ncbi:MAG: hypothetical protein ACRDUW_23295 [Pseudonocardiaceae bacterium]
MTIAEAISLLVALLQNASQISQLIAGAQSAGRTTLSTSEWATILSSDDAARSALVKAITGGLTAIRPPFPTPPVQ